MKSMKRVNFENGKITQNILGVAMPMLVAHKSAVQRDRPDLHSKNT